MISWIIVIVFILIMIILSKLGHFRKKTFILIVIFLILFFYSTLLIINSKNKLDFSTSEGFMNSMKIYGGWLANGFGNLKTIAGNAIKNSQIRHIIWNKMVAYRCFDCRKEVKDEYVKRKVRCPFCGSKILYKTRTISSKVKAE